jgi:hypothetical protein
MTRVAMIVAAFVVACAGCAGSDGPPLPPGPPLTDVVRFSQGSDPVHFILRMPGGRDVNVLVGPRSITGPGFTLTRYTDASDHAIRGTAFDQPADLEVTAEGAKGLFGNGPFDVKVAVVGEEIQVHGTVSGKPAMFALNPRILTGNVGRCMFQMARQGPQYFGTRGCGSGAEGSSMSFPASFGAWSLSEMGPVLAILLSSGS